MSRLSKLLGLVINEFGGLALFLALSYLADARTAIIGLLVWVVIDLGRRHVRKLPMTRIYLITTALALVFGALDLVSPSPRFLPYEAAVTNFLIGCGFLASLWGRITAIQEFAEARQGKAFPDRRDIRRFFQIFTLAWVAYFFIKAGLYAWIATVLPMGASTLVRVVVGNGSLALMMLVSVRGEAIFRWAQARGLLPAVDPAEPAATEAALAPDGAKG